MTHSSFRLWPAELFILKLSASLFALDAFLILLRGVAVDAQRYGLTFGAAAFILAIGLVYRRTGRSEAIASALIACGLLTVFSSLLSALNYLLLPNVRPTIDLWLTGIDSLLGYHWLDAIALSARYPTINELMWLSYNSTAFQIVLVVAILGLTARLTTLHSMMMALVISSIMAVMFWSLFPSLGPSTLYILPDDLLAAVKPVVDTAYGAEITALMQNGMQKLSPDEFRGLVAFPSFHTVMAALALWYAREVRWLLLPLVAVNLFIVPGVLVHGGHHLVDIPAGLAVFVLAAFISQRMTGAVQPEHPASADPQATA